MEGIRFKNWYLQSYKCNVVWNEARFFRSVKINTDYFYLDNKNWF